MSATSLPVAGALADPCHLRHLRAERGSRAGLGGLGERGNDTADKRH